MEFPIAEILDPKIQEFIHKNQEENITKLALKKNPYPELDWQIIINQIAAKQKCKVKLPLWFTTDKIVFPSKLSIEQTSSEITAKYKAGLISGENLIDLTGGFGVDDYYFAQNFKEVVHCELNEELSKVVAHNFKVLNQENIRCVAGDSTKTLKNLSKKFDWIYVDPSRRNDAKGKVFQLKDCLPNVPELLDFYFNFSNSILIKNSPILDISLAISELNFVKKIYIIALENEVKELLIEIEKDFNSIIKVETTNITKNSVEIFEEDLEDAHQVTYSEPLTYLYEPNSAIMKSGLFNSVANAYAVKKLHPHSHLYTSDTLVENFPGRKFLIKENVEFNKQNINSVLKNQKMNLTTRNFPISVEDLRKKYKILDGGQIYTFATTTQSNQKVILICDKL